MTITRHTATLAALALVAGAIGCAGAPSQADTPDAAGTTLTLASVSENNSFDPSLLEIGNRVQYWMPVFDTLLVLDAENQPQPNLATDWAYNDDATVLSLTLRDNVAFTDGTPFNADAVQANMQHLARGNGQNSYMTASIDDYTIIDDHHIDLHLSAPDPALLNYLGVVGGAMASPASLSSGTLGTQPIGSGPYLLDTGRTISGNKYVYTRNTDYWNAAAFPYDTLIIKPIADSTARLNAVRSGQVDAAPVPAKHADDAVSHGLQAHTTQVNWLGLFIVDRDGTQVPALGDRRVRQALNMAVDTQAIVENAAFGEGTATDQIFNPSSRAFDPELENFYPYDPAHAKQLLREAGYADGFSVTMPRTAGYDALNPALEQALAELGITIDWVAEAPDQAINSVLSGKYPMFFFQLGSQSGWQDIQKSVLPDAPWNPFHVERPELTALIESAQYSTGDAQTAALRAVNAWLVDDAWFAPWYRENTVYLTNERTSTVMQPQNVVPWIRSFAPEA